MCFSFALDRSTEYLFDSNEVLREDHKRIVDTIMDFIFTIPLGHVSDVSIGVYHYTPVFGISSFSLNSDLL